MPSPFAGLRHVNITLLIGLTVYSWLRLYRPEIDPDQIVRNRKWRQLFLTCTTYLFVSKLFTFHFKHI